MWIVKKKKSSKKRKKVIVIIVSTFFRTRQCGKQKPVSQKQIPFTHKKNLILHYVLIFIILNSLQSYETCLVAVKATVFYYFLQHFFTKLIRSRLKVCLCKMQRYVV